MENSVKDLNTFLGASRAYVHPHDNVQNSAIQHRKVLSDYPFLYCGNTIHN